MGRNSCLHVGFMVCSDRRSRLAIGVYGLLGGGESLSMLHEAPVKERNTGSEEHAQPLSLEPNKTTI